MYPAPAKPALNTSAKIKLNLRISFTDASLCRCYAKSARPSTVWEITGSCGRKAGYLGPWLAGLADDLAVLDDLLGAAEVDFSVASEGGQVRVPAGLALRLRSQAHIAESGAHGNGLRVAVPVERRKAGDGFPRFRLGDAELVVEEGPDGVRTARGTRRQSLTRIERDHHPARGAAIETRVGRLLVCLIQLTASYISALSGSRGSAPALRTEMVPRRVTRWMVGPCPTLPFSEAECPSVSF